MTNEQIESHLEELMLGNKDQLGSLMHLASIAGPETYNAAKGGTKAQAVRVLCKYYLTPDRFERLWKSLNDAEREITSLNIWSSEHELGDHADEIAKKHKVKRAEGRTSYFYYENQGLLRYKRIYAPNDSPLWLFFPKSSHNEIFKEELLAAVGEMNRVYSKIPEGLVFSSRENRTADFANIVKICNTSKIAFTKGGFLSKASALKLRDFCGYEDFAHDISAKPEDVRTTDSLLVTMPLIELCSLGGVISSVEGYCVPGGKASSLLALPHETLVKKLFETYLKSKSFDEISLIKGIRPKRGHNPTDARQNLARELALCPVGKAVKTKEFERYLRLADFKFARRETRYVVYISNSYYDHETSWEEYEQILIRIILSFFGALGIIDISWGEFIDKRGMKSGRRVPVALRLNNLGAYVLGLTATYKAPKAAEAKIEGGFTVLPDYTVIVPQSGSRLVHELNFDKYFTKVSSTKEASIYRLDFETALRAVNNGGSVADLRKYLSASDKPIPQNVTSSLEDWERQSGRIRLRQVTILECDDAALLEEVIRYKGMGELVKEKVSPAVVVENGAAAKIKKTIEKNKRFCKDVL
jgi:hypothetical protein